ncbi:MAG: hypothetical protein Q8L95_04350 [Burkholderiales bacterium]|nr:hypothetical protein [Burkholderiales bacterium]
MALLPRLRRILWRATVLGVLFGAAVSARAELTCDQLVASAQTGIALRDRGASLGQVLAETEKDELRERFKPDELAMIRRAVRLTFTSEVSIYELAESCAASRGGSRR